MTPRRADSREFWRWLPAGLFVLLALAGLAEAQERGVADDRSQAVLQQQRAIDNELRSRRERSRPLDAMLDWQWGGWIEYYTFHFDDGTQSQRVLQRPGLALWTRLGIDHGAHEFFARMRLRFEYYNPGDEFTRQQDWIGPNLDRGFYQMDVGKALRLTQPSDPIQGQVRIGRQDVIFGTGYAFDLPLDAVQGTLSVYDWRATGLIGKTIASTPNIDRSSPVDNHSGRNIYGVQLGYAGFDRHAPFAYALWNDDHTDERPKDRLQNYAYDSSYFGVGSRGELAHNLSYWFETVYESGRSYGDGDWRSRDEIDAWGLNAGLEYLWDLPARPRAAVEYMFASGDGNRIFNASGAAGGNRGDRRDTSFVAFGYRDTGISASPSLSNIHVWRAGGSLRPAESVELLRELELGSNWFLYQKHQSNGAISDTTADEFSGYVGWEMDYYVNWRIASDLAWTIRWGLFFPGDAFSDTDERSFLFTGLTWSF